MEAAVGAALKLVAQGSSLRKAAADASAPYSSLNGAWRAMGGKEDSPAWKAFVASVPPLPPAAEPAAALEKESPLGARLKRKADRYGDAVPYGKRGPWGMCRHPAAMARTQGCAEAHPAAVHGG